MVVWKIKILKTLMSRRMQASLVPPHKWHEGQFLNYKLDPFGERKELVLHIDEHNTLLKRLVQTVMNLEISEYDKIKFTELRKPKLRRIASFFYFVENNYQRREDAIQKSKKLWNATSSTVHNPFLAKKKKKRHLCSNFFVFRAWYFTKGGVRCTYSA